MVQIKLMAGMVVGVLVMLAILRVQAKKRARKMQEELSREFALARKSAGDLHRKIDEVEEMTK